MVILGISDGQDTGAALVVDDRLVAVAHQGRLESRTATRSFPWEAIDQVLGRAGLAPRDVDLIAVAGRITPPFFARRHPSLRRSARDAFSPAVDASVFYQAMLRGTGLGAMEADRAAEWLEKRFRERGYDPSRLLLVDVHTCLAAAAYRGQDLDNVLILTLQPKGDGAAVAVHRARAGQVDRAWDQKGFSSLHVHLNRCASAVGLEPEVLPLMWSAAGRAEPDPELVRRLADVLHADGPRLSRRAYPLPARRHREVYDALAQAEPTVAAASVLENLAQTVCELVRHHLREADTEGLALGGSVFDNPRLAARVAELVEVEWTAIYPEPGHASLAVGAALAHGGLHPRRMPMPGLGAPVDSRAVQAAMRASGLKANRSVDPVDLLGEGGSLGRFAGHSGWGINGCGSRAVLVRADRPDVVEATRKALGRDPFESPVLALLADEAAEGFPLLPELRAGTRCGSYAPKATDALAKRYPAGVAPDGRAVLQVVDDAEPELLELLTALREKTGCGGLALWPLARGRDPVVDRPADALRIFKDAELDGMILDKRLVVR